MLKRILLVVILTAILLCGVAEYDSRQLPNVINRVMPSVVYVEAPGEWSGSGVIVGPHIVLTAGHVVHDAWNLEITTTNGKTYEAINWVEDEYNDCGLIFFDPREKFENIAEFADSNDLQIGDTVFTTGSPFGRHLFNTVTLGIISGLNREIPYFGIDGLVTSDAATNPGNSGGPVFNMQGQIVGIAVGTYWGADGLNIITSADVCKRLLERKP